MRQSKFFFFLLIVVLFIAACGGGDDDDERPTDRAFPTVTPVSTTIPRVASPTPLPTFDRGPSPTAFAGFPTFQAPPTQGVVVQQNIQIVSPITGATVSGNVSIFGSASHPQFVQYTVEWGPASNPNNLWYPITPQAITVPVVNGVLASWNTYSVPDGTYQIRLHVYLSNNTEITNAVVSNIRVRNNVPTNTPQPVNNNPTISPIASFSLLEGTAATLAVGVFDPNGDPLVISASTDNPGVATVSQSGQALTVRAVSQGVATITVHVSDGRGGNTSTRFVVTVTQARQDNPPSIQAVPGQTLAQGSTITVPLTITDPDGDAVTFTATSGNTTLLDVTTINEPRSVRLTARQPGTTSVRITASDTQGRQATSLFTVVINPRIETNNPPSIGAITSQTIDEGQTRVVNISVSDPDGDTLTVNSSISNEGIVSILQLTETFLTLRGDNAGTGVVTLTVRDGRGGSSSTTFSVTVNEPPPPNQPPSIGPIDARTVAVGESLTVDLTISDPDDDELTTAAISTNPQIVTVGMVDSDTLRITGARTGEASIQIAVGDGRGGSAVAGFGVTVVEPVEPNNPPDITTIDAQTLTVGESLVIGLTVSDPDDDPIAVTVTSSNPSIASIFQNNPGEVTIVGNSVGSTSLTVAVDDGRGGSDATTFTVTVQPQANNPPVVENIDPVVCNPGASSTVEVVFSDPDGDAVGFASVTSEDETIAVVNVLDGGNLEVICAAPGITTVTVSISDGIDTTDVIFQVVVVAPTATATGVDAPSPTVVPPSETPIPTDASTPTPTFTVFPSITPVPPTATTTSEFPPDGGVTATFTDVVPTETSTEAPNQPPVIAPIDDQILSVGQTLPVDVDVTDPDDDELTVTAQSDTPEVAVVSMDEMTVNIFGVETGTAEITVTVSDDSGATASVDFTVEVIGPTATFTDIPPTATFTEIPPTDEENQDPVIAPIPDQTVEVGQTISGEINVSDPDGDELTITAESDRPARATVSVEGTTISIEGVSAGNATITIQADDGRGGTATTSFDVSIVAPTDTPAPATDTPTDIPPTATFTELPPTAEENQDPVIAPIPDQTVEVGQTISGEINVSDPDDDELTITAESDRPARATVSVEGTTITIEGVSAGNATITVQADDGRGGTATTSFDVAVVAPTDTPVPATETPTDIPPTATFTELAPTETPTEVPATDTPTEPANEDPVVAPIPDQTVEVGQTISGEINVSDPDDDELTITAESDRPARATVSVEGTTITIEGVSAGNATITVQADDGRGGTATTSFNVAVVAPTDTPVPATDTPTDIPPTATFTELAPTETPTEVPPTDTPTEIPNQNPVIAPIPDQTVEVGQTISGEINVSDPDGDELTITAESDRPARATASVDGTTVTVVGVSAGNAIITVQVDDGRGGTATTSFNVTVVAPTDTPVPATDTPTDVPPTATFTELPPTETPTEVPPTDTPTDVPNQNPVIAPIPDQTVEVGQTITGEINVSDPDGDPLTITAESDRPARATASVDGTTVTVVGVSAGNAIITVQVDDGRGGTATTSFNVTVVAPTPTPLPPTATFTELPPTETPTEVPPTDTPTEIPNQNPVIAPIPDQTVEVGQTITGEINVSDPDGDPLTITAESDRPARATASVDGATVTVVGVSAGNAIITVQVDDGRGGTATTSFNVTVVAPTPTPLPPTATFTPVPPTEMPPTPTPTEIPNQDPVIEPIGEQTVEAGQTIQVPVNASDPDGDPLSIVAQSDTPDVATVVVDGATVNVNGVDAGTATITVSADDGRGGVATTTFPVTVTALAPPTEPPPSEFDITQIPQVPDIEELLSTLQPIFNAGIQAGNRPNVVAFAGDDLVNDGERQPNPLSPIANGNYDLGDNQALQAVIDFFTAAEAHTGEGTSFAVNSAAVGDSWDPRTLLQPNASDAPFCQQGESPLECELRVAMPSTMIVSFIPTNATALNPNQFQNNLQTVVDTIIDNGTIPVLVTLPDDGTVDAATLSQYNQIIVEIADEAGIPLYNWYMTVNTINPYSIGGTGPTDFTADALNSGINSRNLAILRLLNRLRADLLQQ